jgi:hypothetical protein
MVRKEINLCLNHPRRTNSSLKVSLLEVAITLNLREDKVTEFYKESWTLNQIYDLNRIYLETKGDIASIVTLYKLAKAESMSPQHVTKILSIANNDLQGLENKCENLRIEINSLKEQVQNSQRILRDLNNQITEASSNVEYYRASCQQEDTKLWGLRQKRMKLEALVRQFENNNPEYLKIRKTAEEKVSSTLSNGKDLLKLALFSLIQSMRKDPDRYISLFYDDTPSTIDYGNQQYSSYCYGSSIYGQQQNHSREEYMAMLVEETDKLFNDLVKELVDEIISEHAPSLPVLSPSKREDFPPNT